MIRIIAGGKKSADWVAEACFEYEKRLRKPFDVVWEVYDEGKLAKYLEKWPFGAADKPLPLRGAGTGKNGGFSSFVRIL